MKKIWFLLFFCSFLIVSFGSVSGALEDTIKASVEEIVINSKKMTKDIWALKMVFTDCAKSSNKADVRAVCTKMKDKVLPALDSAYEHKRPYKLDLNISPEDVQLSFIEQFLASPKYWWWTDDAYWWWKDKEIGSIPVALDRYEVSIPKYRIKHTVDYPTAAKQQEAGLPSLKNWNWVQGGDFVAPAPFYHITKNGKSTFEGIYNSKKAPELSLYFTPHLSSQSSRKEVGDALRYIIKKVTNKPDVVTAAEKEIARISKERDEGYLAERLAQSPQNYELIQSSKESIEKANFLLWWDAPSLELYGSRLDYVVSDPILWIILRADSDKEAYLKEHNRDPGVIDYFWNPTNPRFIWVYWYAPNDMDYYDSFWGDLKVY